MSDVRWIETTREVYAAIYREHIGQLDVFATISRPEDDWYGDRQMMTEWGFKGADYPLIKHHEIGTPATHQYFIAAALAGDTGEAR